MNMTPCFVSDDSGENTRALLIGFYQKAWTHGASIAIGGFPAGQVAFPVAVVLLESGDVVTVDAKSVTIDAPEEIFSQYAWTGEVNDQSVNVLNTCDNCNYARVTGDISFNEDGTKRDIVAKDIQVVERPETVSLADLFGIWGDAE